MDLSNVAGRRGDIEGGNWRKLNGRPDVEDDQCKNKPQREKEGTGQQKEMDISMRSVCVRHKSDGMIDRNRKRQEVDAGKWM